MTNATEDAFNDFCRKAQAEGAPESRIRDEWKKIEKKAAAGDLDARHMIAHMALAHKEYDPAHRILAGLADAGHTLARLDLAHLHEEGLGIEANAYDAIRLYRLAAAAGHPLAIFKLAQQHLAGGLLRTDALLANAIMERLAARYPQMFRRNPSCGGCAGQTDKEFAVRTVSQLSRLIRWAIIIGLVIFGAYFAWTEFIR